MLYKNGGDDDMIWQDNQLALLLIGVASIAAG
jgi:hypothetical protein